MAKVFVSYSRKDIEFAKRLTVELQKSDLDFWIDWEGIPPTVDWWREIEKGIEEADIFLFLISPDSSASKVCGQEIDTAVKNSKRIIPLVVRDVKGDEAPKQLGHLNWIFFREQDEFNGALQKLFTAIQTDYEWAATHRRLQVKALEWERNHKDHGFLLRGKDLIDAETNLATNTSKEPHPTDLQRSYVLESRKATDKQRRTITGISIAGVIALALLAVFGFYQASVATSERATAEANLVVAQTAQADAKDKQILANNNAATAVANEQEAKRQATISRAGELSAQSELLSNRDFHGSLLLAVEAFRTLDSVQTRGALLDSATTNPQLVRYFPGQAKNVSNVKFSPDGKTIASLGDGTVTLWDAASLLPLGQASTGDRTSIAAIAFSRDGKTLASSQGTNIVLWDVSDPAHPKQKGQPLTGHTALVSSLAFNPNDGTLASVSWDQTIIFWDLTTGTALQQLPTGHTNNIFSIAFSRDGTKFATGAVDFRIILWDSATRVPLRTLEGFHSYSLAFSPDGRKLASGTTDATVVLWDLETGQRIGQPLTGHTDIVTGVAFNFDGTLLASSSLDKTIILWNAATGQAIGQPYTGHAAAANTLDFSPNSNTNAFVSGGNDGLILWDATVQSPIAQVITSDCCTGSISVSTDGKTLVAGMNDSIVLWDVQTLQPIGQPIRSNSTVVSVALSPDNRMIASASMGSNEVSIWDAGTGQPIGGPLKGHATGVDVVTFSPNGKILVSGSHMDGTVILWDTQTLKPLGEPIQDAVNNLAISPDGKTLATGGVFLWDITDPAQPKRIDPQISGVNGAYAIAFSPDGRTIAFGAEYGVVLWDVATRQPIGYPLTGHAAAVKSLSFSSDGKTLASSGLDLSIILWDVSDPAQPRTIGQPLQQNNKGISVAFTSLGNGNMFASTNATDLLLWSLEPDALMNTNCQRAGRNFTPTEWMQYFPDEEYRATCEQWPLEP